MPAFAAAFFPYTATARAHAHSAADGSSAGGARYCMCALRGARGRGAARGRPTTRGRRSGRRAAGDTVRLIRLSLTASHPQV
jgi:hypothetical protein